MAMRMAAILVAAAMAALCPGHASAQSLCPDETGAYTPEACDLILPFEPNPDRVECDIVADIEAGEAHPVCLDYYRKLGFDETMLARLRVPT